MAILFSLLFISIIGITICIISFTSSGKSLDCFTSIDDVTLWVCRKITETNDLSYLLKSGTRKINNKEAIALSEIWQNIHWEDIDTFGTPENMQKVINLKRDICILRAKIEFTGNKTHNTFLKIKRLELEELLGNTDAKTDIASTLVVIEEQLKLGFALDEKTLTIKKYREYVKRLETKIVRK